MSVNDIVEEVKGLIPSFQTEFIQAFCEDVQSFELDITKLRKRLGKLKITPFNDALKKTIEWQVNNM